VVERVRNLNPAHGLNAATGEYVNLLTEGIIDPAKVTRSALQNAASIAALFLTTEAVVADKPEKEKAPAGGPRRAATGVWPGAGAAGRGAGQQRARGETRGASAGPRCW